MSFLGNSNENALIRPNYFLLLAAQKYEKDVRSKYYFNSVEVLNFFFDYQNFFT